MGIIPTLVGISDLRLHQSEVLRRLKQGPIVLTQRTQAIAVLVSPEHWNQIMEQIEDLEDALEVAQAREADEPTTDLRSSRRPPARPAGPAPP